MKSNRRKWLTGVGAGALGGMALPDALTAQDEKAHTKPKPLDLSQYEPRSMLHVKETRVVRARYPVIDMHTHLSESAKGEKGVALAAERVYTATPDFLLPVMERHNLRALTNLTGGFGTGLVDAVSKYDRAHPGRFYTFTEPSY